MDKNEQLRLALAARQEMARRELEKRKIKDDEVYFFENYVHIENKSGNIEERSVLFHLFPEQRRVLKEINENKLNVIIKARQLGMTWLAVGHSLHKSLTIPQYTTAILSQTEDYMKEAINRFVYIIQRMPKWYINEYNKDNLQDSIAYLYEQKSDEITIYHPVKDGMREISSIKGLVSTAGSGRSLTADLLIFDEWAYHSFAEEVFQAAYPTINRPDSGTFIGISTNKRGSFFEDVVKDCLDEGKMNFNLLFLAWNADPRRDQKFYEESKAVLKNTYRQEYPTTVYDALSAGDKTAFSEFDPNIHICEPFPIPKHWIKWASVDNGLGGIRDPYCWLKFAVSEDGTTYAYYEYTTEKGKGDIVYYSDQAKKFMEDCKTDITEDILRQVDDLHLGYELPDESQYYEKERLQYIVFGLDAFFKDTAKNTGKSLIDFYQEGGLDYPVARATANRQMSKSIVHEYLKPYEDCEGLEGVPKAKLQIFSTCKYLIKYIPQLVVDDNNPNVVEGNSKIDNVYDCLAYGLIASPRHNAIPIKEEEPPILRYRKNKIKKMRKGRRKGVLN